MRRKFNRGIGVCSECHQSTGFVLEDQGIGSYEYWGAKGTHHDYQWVSECCEAFAEGEVDVVEPEPQWDTLSEKEFDHRFVD